MNNKTDINFELYKVFYYVATTLSFSEAACKLFISQSAVSQSIKTLEKKLNQTLFIRSTKKVRLTPEGEILLRHIEPAVQLIVRGESQLLESSSGIVSSASAQAIRSAGISSFLIWNSFTRLFLGRISKLPMLLPSAVWNFCGAGRSI